jgi:glycosyltransferase involved in cell wall biosynthesis
MTAPGWSTGRMVDKELDEHRQRIRAALGISQHTIVVGLAGSLNWNRRTRYCYGYELVKAAHRVERDDVVFLIVGGGSGQAHLEALAGDKLGRTLHLTGAVRREEVMGYLASMDIGSLPQSCDKVGNFRYSSKMAEYVAAQLPTVTGAIPAAYDLDTGWLWRIEGAAPWSDSYIQNLVAFLDTIDAQGIEVKKAACQRISATFDEEVLVDRVTGFLTEILLTLNKFERR